MTEPTGEPRAAAGGWLVPVAADVLAAAVIGGFVIGLADLFANAWRPDMAPLGAATIGSAAVAGAFGTAASLLCAPLLLLLALPFRRPLRLDTGSFLRGIETIAPSGRNKLMAFALPLSAVAASLGLREIARIGPGKSPIEIYAEVALALIGAVLVLSAYAFTIRRRPALRTNTRWLAVCALVGGYVLTMEYGVDIATLYLFATWPAFALCGAVVFAPGEERRTAVRASALVLFVASIAVLATHDRDGREHDELVRRGILGFPALQLVDGATDFDSDGFSSIAGGRDCAPFDNTVHPASVELAGNGDDDNCALGDPETAEAEALPEVLIGPARFRPNVVVVTIDTLRSDIVHRQVAGKPLMPWLSAFAGNAFEFESAYAPSTHTAESIPATMAGVLPMRWRYYGTYLGLEPTLADILAANGFQTAAVTALPVTTSALKQGFQSLDNRVGEGLHLNHDRFVDDRTGDNVAAFLQQRGPTPQPLFLWVHFFGPHQPNSLYEELEPWLGDDPYLHDTHLADRSFGQLLRILDTFDVLKKSIVVVHSDHGEALGEHRIETHGWAAFESIIRVPFLIKLPGMPAGRTAVPASTMDMTPTVLEFLEIPDGAVRDGVSRMPAVRGEPERDAPVFFESSYPDRPLLRGVRVGNWKFVEDFRRGNLMLFDLATDPRERQNLIDASPEVAAELRRKIRLRWEEVLTGEHFQRRQQLLKRAGSR